MIMTNNKSNNTAQARSGERGAALAAALLMLGLLSAVAMTVLAVVTTETRIAGSDLRRTQTFYATAAGIEKMTSDYSALFQQSARPTSAQISSVALAPPTELDSEGFEFEQSILPDTDTLASMRATQGILAPKLPFVTLPADSPYVGLIASVNPYILKSKATYTADGTSVTLTRTMNNYLIPLFQFGMFSDSDIELHPGADFVFNGRVHANGNIYLAGRVKMFDKVTSAHEVIYHRQRNGVDFGQTSVVSMGVGASAINVVLDKGSIQNGPHLPASLPQNAAINPNWFPGSPSGTVWGATFNWQTTSVQTPVVGSVNKFGGQLLTRVTGASKLELPMQLGGNPTREIIKRRLAPDNLPAPAETSPLSDSRYHTKAGIRILIDDEGVTNDAAGLYATQNGDGTNSHDGVNLSTFDPIPLPNAALAANGGRALWRVNAAGTAYTDTALSSVVQQNTGVSGGTAQALTVRGVRGTTRNDITPTGSTVQIPRIPAGAGLSGHILIQIADANGVWRDVTREILSMGVTVGEPNAIVHLQRPLWTAFAQGSRDASGGTNQNLTDILNNTYMLADGEIRTSTAPSLNATYGYLTGITDDVCTSSCGAAGVDLSGARPIRPDTPPALNIGEWNSGPWNTNKRWNTIVPINVYNIREGRLSTSTAAPNLSSNANAVYERGITNVIEINMKNLARWIDGVYDTNLLANTPAVSANITNPDGWILYVSDRRGDNVKTLTVPNPGTDPVTFGTIQASNGMADNMDIYGPNGSMDPGEDVQETGAAMVKDTAELPDPAVLAGTSGSNTNQRIERALTVAAWSNPSNYFRRAVRLFNAEDLQTDGATGNLSTTLGLTVATENMVYTWGNYNTAGINVAPAAGVACQNEPAKPCHYMPVATVLCPSCDRQVPASIVADAWFPLSKTWFDSSSAMNPDDFDLRVADLKITGTLPVDEETSIRAGIIAGNNLSALAGTPDAGNSANNESRLNGGMHNFLRLLENWDGNRLNFVGALIPLYRSTQALGPYNNNATTYRAPLRDWAFDSTFRDPLRLPPGTPLFQHVEPTGFKQVL
jgi:hypothetical protein